VGDLVKKGFSSVMVTPIIEAEPRLCANIAEKQHNGRRQSNEQWNECRETFLLPSG
jgi:hypothetical protein